MSEVRRRTVNNRFGRRIDSAEQIESNVRREKSINKHQNNTLRTFTVRKCHIKRVMAYERRNKLTMHQ